MKFILLTLILLINLIIPSNALSQELTIQETIDYINEKLNLDGNKDKLNKEARFEWSVTKDGKLIIKRYWYNKLSIETSIYLKQLDTSLVQVYKETGNTKVFGLIKIYAKGNFQFTCRSLKDEYSEEKIYETFMIDLSFNADQTLTNQLKNSIDHLITLSKTKKEYREKDPFED